MASNTYLFQVGIIGPLISKFQAVFYVHPFYAFATICVGVYRANKFSGGTPFPELWDSPSYVTCSVLHKLIAVLYYYLNMNVVMKLGDASLYSKDALVAMVTRPPPNFSTACAK